MIKYTSLDPKTKDMSWGNQGVSGELSDTQSPGSFSFENLDEGYYEIVETKYPTGYIQATENPVFQVKYGNESVAPEVLLVYGSDDDAGHHAGDPITGNRTDMVSIANYAITVGNTPGAALPNTGGPGTNLFYLIGAILTMLAGGGVVLKRRKMTA